MPTEETLQNAVHALAVTHADDGAETWFAAKNNGLTYSANYGLGWQDAYSSLELDAPLTASALTLSPSFSDDSTLFAGALGGVLRSTDSGQTWSVATLPTPPPYVIALVVSPNYERDGLVFAATLEDGVFRSWDRGHSWASWNFGLLDLNAYCLFASEHYADDETLYVGVESGIFRSANGGRAWRETAFPMEYGPVLSLTQAMSDDQQTYLLAGTENHGVFRSSDDGATWSPTEFPQSQGPVNQLLAHATAGPGQAFAITGSAIYASDEGGAWQEQFRLDSPNEEQISAAAVSGSGQDATFLIGTNRGLVQQIKLQTRTN